MKKLIAILVIVLPIGCFGSIITFQCKSTEVEGIHKFDAKGIVTVDEYDKVEGVISLQVQKAQATGSIQVFEELKIEGTHRHYNAGEITANSFEQFNLFTKDSYIKSFNLLVDLKAELASQVFSIDNFLYRSNCFVVDSTK